MNSLPTHTVQITTPYTSAGSNELRFWASTPSLKAWPWQWHFCLPRSTGHNLSTVVMLSVTPTMSEFTRSVSKKCLFSWANFKFPGQVSITYKQQIKQSWLALKWREWHVRAYYFIPHIRCLSFSGFWASTQLSTGKTSRLGILAELKRVGGQPVGDKFWREAPNRPISLRFECQDFIAICQNFGGWCQEKWSSCQDFTVPEWVSTRPRCAVVEIVHSMVFWSPKRFKICDLHFLIRGLCRTKNLLAFPVD